MDHFPTTGRFRGNKRTVKVRFLKSRLQVSNGSLHLFSTHLLGMARASGKGWALKTANCGACPSPGVVMRCMSVWGTGCQVSDQVTVALSTVSSRCIPDNEIVK